MKSYFYKLFTSLAFLGILVSILGFTPVFAQYTSPSIPSLLPEIQEPVTVSISPESPRANESVTATLTDNASDLNRAYIVWNENGKVVEKGTGQTSFTFTTGVLGSVTKINIAVTPVNGTEVDKSISVAPADVDIVYEADTYTPPFYKGKALYSNEADLHFVAMPNLIENGVKIDPSKIIYKWTQDTKVLGSLSGYGKNTLDIAGSIILNQSLIEVDASSLDGTVTAHATVQVDPIDPSVVVYDNNPLYGVLYNNGIQNSFDLNSETEVNLKAIPYYFSALSPDDSSMTYDWEMNNNSIEQPANQNNVVFRQVGSQSGSSNVSLTVGNNDKLLQQATSNFSLSFGDNTTKNIFGF